MVTSTDNLNLTHNKTVNTPWGAMILKKGTLSGSDKKVDMTPCDDEIRDICPCYECSLANLADIYMMEGYTVIDFVIDFTIDMNQFEFLPTINDDNVDVFTQFE